MTFNGGGSPFPVVYWDGETLTNLGILTVDPTMNFKSIISILSNQIGISPHQFTVFLADQDSDQKTPLSAKFNLSALSRNGGEYYLFVRRTRRFKKSPTKNKNVADKIMFMRRNGAVNQTAVDDYRPSFSILERAGIERRMLRLRMEKEAFLRSLRNKGESFRETPYRYGDGYGGAWCKECVVAEEKGTYAGFHLCVRDKVIKGFKSTAGPISRPESDSGDNGSN
ncbi:uncharacterized protein [Cicer arietinum]|uniref:Uncharacterized protein LOC101506520 n=1 Tax=Cicer arietinum TaxID=3827 RepID=A0A1S2Y145_CICAR|nr:uncharacterized protein LOC101506520 [Cicer arietinum]